MIEYIIENNPDDRILMKASSIVKRGGLICFPAETNWLIACDPFHKEAVKKLYQLKNLNPSKHLTVLCADFSKAESIALIENSAFNLLKKVVPGPYTFIFHAQKIMKKSLKASKIDHEVGIKFSSRILCQKIVNACSGWLLTTHLDHHMIQDADENYPLYGALIEDHLKNHLDLIIDPGEVEFLGPSTIIDFTQGYPIVQREGLGDAKLFSSIK